MTYRAKVLLIYTGGTIGMNRNPATGALEPFDFEHLLVNVPELTQFDTTAFGTVDSVSLSSTLNNGIATYPMTILADNSDETLQINSNIQYSLVASQNDNCLIVPVQCVHNVANESGESISVVYVAGEFPPDDALENVMDTEMIPEGFWPVEVETGIQDSYNVEIRSGVEEGMEVFTQMQMSYGFGFFG